MGEKTTEIINSIKKSLREGPKSISDISKEAKINWRTAEQNLKLLKSLNLVIEKDIKNTRTFFYQEKNNYFDLPVKAKDSKYISTLYAHIKKFCHKFHNKEPTKTQVYKILWKINQTLKKNLPIGWYRYGPMCVQEYMNNEKEEIKLDPKTISLVKSITKEYCACENKELQRKIYEEEDEKLYLTKEDLLSIKKDDKKEINPILMDFIKFSPPESIEAVTDFVRATLLAGWSETQEIFDNLWKYLTMTRFRDSLKPYYGEGVDIYLKQKIEATKKETQILTTDLVRSKVK